MSDRDYRRVSAMLRIRAEQFDAFKDLSEAAFMRRVAGHLRDKHGDAPVQLPDQVCTVKQLREDILIDMVRKGIARARSYGMSWESTLTAFVAIMFVAAPNFDEHPLIQRVLKDENAPADSRIDQLWERTSDQNWEAVQRSYDPRAWGIEEQPQRRADTREE